MIEFEGYKEDGRASLHQLNARYDGLASQYGFIKDPIYRVTIESDGAQHEVTVYCYRSSKIGPALWVLSGIHGEEPAGPNAIAQNIESLSALGQDIPLVIMPLLNPRGYSRNWRYPDERRDWRLGYSVGDSEHYLPDTKNPSQPRIASPRTEFSAKITRFVLDTMVDYPPVLTVDHHEDENIERGYIYSQAHHSGTDRVATAAIDILSGSGIPLEMSGLTRFGEPIRHGVVVGDYGQPVNDGSVDELLAAEKIIVAGQVVAKPSALMSLVIETPITTLSLDRRIEAHSNIIRRLRFLWTLVNQ